MAKGMSTSNVLADGGFSPSTDALNLLNTPGVMYHSAFETDASTGLTGEMIASTEDPSGNYTRLYTSANASNGNGLFWSMNGVFALTQRGSTDNTHQYIQGKTDMISFGGEAYITSQSTIVRWSSIGSSDTIDNTWFSFNSAFAPHPGITYNSFAYYGDGNLLLRQSAANVAPTTILTLPTGTIIVALGVDPGSGQLLISVIGQTNLSDTINSGARVLFYDGFSNQVLRQIAVDDMITAFPATEGALYAAYGQTLGLWNGSGVTFLRHMAIQFDNTQLMYKHHFTSIGSTLYFVERSKIIAYGPIRQKGDNIFYPAHVNNAGLSTDITSIANIGQNKMSYSYSSNKFAIWDTYGVTSNVQTFFCNPYEFDDEVWVRRARVIYGTTVSNNVSPGQLNLYNEDGFIATGGNGSGAYLLTNTSGAASAYKDILNINLKLKQLQFRLVMDTTNPGIRRIIFYGDPADLT